MIQIPQTFWLNVSSAFLGLCASACVFVLTWLKIRVNYIRRNLHSPLEKSNQKDKAIQELCQECGIRLNHATRVYVVQYKNGEIFDAGNSIRWTRRVCEWDRGDTVSVLQNYTEILASTITQETDLVLQSGPSFTVVSTMPRSTFKSMCERDRIQAIARCCIKKGDQVVAFLGADFDCEEKPENIGEIVRFAGLVALELMANER
jgi:hypothetical protein